MKRLTDRRTVILEWRGDAPVIECYPYNDRSVYWYCSECKRYHYCYPTGGIVSRCGGGAYQAGHYIRVGSLL